MNRILSKYIDKLFFKKWIIGICRENIEDIIKNKKFDPDIKWFMRNSYNKFIADPFFLGSNNGRVKIIYEEYTYDDNYGKISLMSFNESLMQVHYKMILDTKSHLSYPFVYKENNKTYVFPEAKQSGKLSCYEFDPINESLNFIKVIIDLPLLDSTILKCDDKYWIYGTLSENGANYKLFVFYSERLLGPYTPHPNNPIKSGLNGVRSAGSFIQVDGIIYRPTQNCKKKYGESITINKVTELNKFQVSEETYMNITINRSNNCNKNMHKIHTINYMDGIIIVDGEHWTFSPIHQFKKFAKSLIKPLHFRNIKE